MANLRLLSFALFFSLLVSFGSAQSNFLTYMYNPDCNTGCDLLATANWNGTINSNSTLLIIANQTSTFILNNTKLLEVASLTFGVDGSPVTLIINNSTLSTKNSEYSSGLSWYGNSAVYATDSIIVSLSVVNGSYLFLQNSTFLGSIVSVLQTTANGGEFGAVGLALSVGNASISNGSLTAIGADFYVDNLFTYNSTVTVQNFRLSNYSIFQNCSFATELTVFFQNNSVAEFHDSPVNVSQIFFTPGALFSFHSDNSNSSLMVDSVTYVEVHPIGSELHLGSNVDATIGSGTIANLTVGHNVNIQTGNGYDLYIVNMQQDSADVFTTISATSRLHLQTSIPVNASIFVTGQYSALYVIQLFLAAGSSINGNGQLNMNGILHCPTCNVSIGSVVWSWYNNTAPDLVVDYLYTPSMAFDSFSGASATVYGDVVLTPSTYTGFQAYANYLMVNGSYTQYGGYLNVTVNKDSSSTTPIVQVTDPVSLQNVTIVVDVSLLLKDKSSYLLVNSLSNNLTATGTIIQNWDTSAMADKLKLTQTGGGLYFGLDGPSHHNFGGLKTWQIAAIAGGAAGGVVLIALIIFIVRRMNHKRHYEKIAR